MSIDFILPDIGEGIVECELVEWLVKEGDAIVEDQPIADVMTDKALVQIPAMHSGVIEKLFYQQGEIAKVHEPLFSMIADAAGENVKTKEADADKPHEATSAEVAVTRSAVKQAVTTNNSVEPAQKAAQGKAIASPAVRRVARELDINISEVPGSGKKGRVYKDDVVAFEQGSNSTATPSYVETSYVEKIKQAQSENATELEALMPSILDKAFKGELV